MPASSTISGASAGPARPPTLFEAFASSAAALRHFGIPRIRVVGLSSGCKQREYERQRARPDGKDLETLLQESSLRGPHGELGTASRRIHTEQDALLEATANADAPIVTEQEFMHKFVFHSRPCVILDALATWPAMTKWRDDRYVFDLDHALPLEAEKNSEDDDDEEEGEEGDEEDADVESSDGDKKGNADATQTEVALGLKKVTVALTPNGRADAVTHVTYSSAAVPADEASDVYAGAEARKQAVLLPPSADAAVGDAVSTTLRQEKIFMYAAELRVTLSQLYGLLQRSPVCGPPNPIDIDMRTYADAAQTPAIAYAQLQNNCLNTEYTHLHVDLRPNVEQFGCRVFDKDAVEAANVWFGVPASVSSMHQDWVENLYSVVRGVKEFVLIPPWEGPFVPKPEIPAAAFAIDEAASVIDRADDRAASWSLCFKQYPVKDGTVVPWMDFDLPGATVEDDANGAARLELEGRLLEKRRVRAAATTAPAQNDAAAAAGDVEAAREEASRKPLHPLVAYVHPGETLYLPAMWLHRVAQHADSTDLHARARHRGAGAAAAASDPPLPLIAAVNYWYDMSFNNPAVVLLREFGLLL